MKLSDIHLKKTKRLLKQLERLTGSSSLLESFESLFEQIVEKNLSLNYLINALENQIEQLKMDGIR